MEIVYKKKIKLFIEEKFKISSYRSSFYISWINMYKKFAVKSDSSDNLQDSLWSTVFAYKYERRNTSSE